MSITAVPISIFRVLAPIAASRGNGDAVAARSDEPGSRLRPFQGARPLWRGQWTAGARRPPTVFVTAVKLPNDRMRGSQFSSCNISLTYRGHKRADS